MKTKNTIIALFLLVSTMSFAQKSWEPYHQFGVSAGYLFSSNTSNTNASRPLFGGNGVTVGITDRWGDKFGMGSRFAFATGTVSESGLNNFVNSLPVPPKYRVERNKTNWSQLSLMVGPSLNLGPKNKVQINVLGGIGYANSRNSIKIDAYDQDVLLGTVYQAQEKSFTALWEVGANVRLARISKSIGLSLNGSYGSNGATIGVSLAIYQCHLCSCCKPCPWGCPETPKKGNK
ncbi:outer membrane beta-barrel protein [Flavobacterium sp. SUN052]|uniref:outer membrane beta-barrel protein n=1 Tax=Flavobacterium sp. SUN052 TaxID=3002441 RepID=UPI00237DCD5B|nr:outer membrane beta-barrel protein [Flavobacterium sp. SUN052]MEC4003704.1 outer membrane beta-barrel protein [Flavobacterium sp. SUN052]